MGDRTPAGPARLTEGDLQLVEADLLDVYGAALRAAWAENARWRELLWMHHGHLADLYGDDGERQCHRCRLDYRTSTPNQIEWRFLELAALAAPGAGENGGEA